VEQSCSCGSWTEARGIAFTPELRGWTNKLGFVVDDNTGGRRQRGGTECGIIAADNAVAFAAAGGAWRTLPESALAASASTQQLELAAATVAEWAAPGRHDNVLRRFLGDVEVARLVISVAARCGVLPLISKAVAVQTWTKDLFLLHVANDVLCGDSTRCGVSASSTPRTVTSADCTDYIILVVH
jgi:hypothetical protein